VPKATTLTLSSLKIIFILFLYNGRGCAGYVMHGSSLDRDRDDDPSSCTVALGVQAAATISKSIKNMSTAKPTCTSGSFGVRW
jgi:hypothetical protein